MYSGPGCGNIVNQKNRFAAYPLIPADSQSPSQIVDTLGLGEPNLRGRVLKLAQGSPIQFDACFPRQFLSEDNHLIETS
jgi:hypothetical protein